jgi:serine/threonine protein kinase
VTPRGALKPGRRLAGDYEVIAHLARSNVLDVYDAWWAEGACRVVIKTLRPDKRKDGRSARALLGEGRLLGSLTHPHIVRAYATLRAPWPAVVLETLRGETLAHLVERRERRLSAAELGFLGLHLCSAVGYLHGRGIVHLDIKPSNVIAEAGRAKLIDLSVARRAGRCRPEVGTWCYMAPEQVRGGEIGLEADVFGIGGVLFEAATGDCAFDDEADAGVDYPQLARDAPPVAARRRGLPLPLRAAIDAALAREAAARPTLPELAAACEDAAGLPADERLASGGLARRSGA